MSVFEREYVGTFEPPSFDDEASRLALRYHVLVEAHDRSLPGHWIRPGEWLPRYYHMTDSRRVAFSAAKAMWAEARARGIDNEEMNRALRNVAALPFEEQKDLLERS